MEGELKAGVSHPPKDLSIEVHIGSIPVSLKKWEERDRESHRINNKGIDLENVFPRRDKFPICIYDRQVSRIESST